MRELLDLDTIHGLPKRFPADPEQAREEVRHALYFIAVQRTEVLPWDIPYPGRQPLYSPRPKRGVARDPD